MMTKGVEADVAILIVPAGSAAQKYAYRIVLVVPPPSGVPERQKNES